MSAALFARLAELGVSVERSGSRLLLDGPEDALTEALIAEVAAAKPSLLAMLGSDERVDEAEHGTPGSADVSPDPSISKDDQTTFADSRAEQDVVSPADATDGPLRQAPWRCRCCGSGERRPRAEWGDWVCAFCRAIVAGPASTERSWRTLRRYGPFSGDGQPAVTWGRERGYLAVRDPHTGDWHEIPYREAPPVWQAAVRRGRASSSPGARGSSDRRT